MLLASVLGVTASALCIKSLLRNPSVGLLPVILLATYAATFFVIPPFLALDQFDESAITTASRWALASILGISTAVGLWHHTTMRQSFTKASRSLSMSTSKASSSSGRKLALLSGAVGLVFVVGGAIATHGNIGAAFGAGRLDARSSDGALVAALAAHGSRLLLVSTALFASSARRHWKSTVVIVSTYAILILIFSKGTRGLLLGVVGIGAYGLLMSAGRRRSGAADRGSTRFVLKLVVVGLLVGWLGAGLYEGRKVINDGWQELASETVGGPLSGEGLERDPFNYFEFTVLATEIGGPTGLPGQFLAPVRRLIFFPLRSGGIKPAGTPSTFGRLVASEGVTVPPSIPGEGGIVIGGTAGAYLWGLLYGLTIMAAVWCVGRSRVMALVWFSSSFEIGLLAVRGQYYEIVLSTFSLFLMCWALMKIAPLRSNPRIHFEAERQEQLPRQAVEVTRIS